MPCNQFGLQEPGANGTEILNTLKYVRPGHGFEPLCTLTEKVDVNGPKEHPLYTYLKNHCDSPIKSFSKKDRLMYEELSCSDIRWNFEKFLIDRNGKPVKRYTENVQPLDLSDDIEHLLNQSTVSENFKPRKIMWW